MFKKAEKKQSRLRLALAGPSGSGKTFGALAIAKGLGGKVAVLDTERGSASLYADMYDFDVVELGPDYTPERYIDIINAAAKEGYDTLILDSITHEWSGKGGVLEIVDNIAKTKYRGNSYAAWNEGTPRHQKFVDAMLAAPMNVIATMRSKTVYVETEKPNGKKSIEKQGTAPQQRDGLEYEFTVVLDIAVDGHLALASKDRTRLFKDPFVITEEVGHRLKDWLNSGTVNPMIEQQKQYMIQKAFIACCQSHGINDSNAFHTEMTNFFGREVNNSKDLTSAEMQDYIDAVASAQAEKEQD